MLQQYLLVARIERHRRRTLCVEQLDLLAAEPAAQRRYGDENAVAIARESLRLDDRPGVRRRRDIHVGDVLVPQRPRHQHRRVGAKRGIDIPARLIAARRIRFAGAHQRADQQHGADHAAVALEQVAVFGQLGGGRMPAQTHQSFPPEFAIARAKSIRQQRGDRLGIAFPDLSAAQRLRSRNRHVDRGNA